MICGNGTVRQCHDHFISLGAGDVTAADHLFCWDKGDQAISAERFSPAGDLESPDSITRRVRSDNSSMLASV